MDTTSTPSSATDGSEAAPPEPATPAAAPTHDAGRRAFFRSFGRQAFDTAAQVVGISGAVTKATTGAVVNVAGILADPDGAAARIEAGSAAAARALIEDLPYVTGELLRLDGGRWLR